MLRITQRAEASGRALQLEGKLVGQWVDLLRSAGPGARTLDLAHVTFVDLDGLDLLHDLRRQGVELLNVSGFITELLRAERADP